MRIVSVLNSRPRMNPHTIGGYICNGERTIGAPAGDFFGGWHHVFVTYDGSSKALGTNLFVNGRRVPPRVIEYDSLSQSIRVDSPLRIGARTNLFPFEGAIDDVRVYDRVLTSDEVKKIFLFGQQLLGL